MCLFTGMAFRKYLTILSGLWILLMVSASVSGDDHAHPDQPPHPAQLMATDAYIYVPIAGRTMTAGYFTLTNSGEKDYQLVAVESVSAGRIELHSHQHVDGVMKMRREAQVPIPAGAEVVFAPGGLHLMLFDLTPGPQTGQQLDLTLIFDDGSRLPLVAAVKSRFDRPHH